MNFPSLRDEIHFFPNLIEKENFFFKSKYDQNYNCIAWAIIKNNVWVEPVEGEFDGIFWPPGLDKGLSFDHLVSLFKFYGYSECESSVFEEGFMKVALYGKEEKWTHAARQTPNGMWASKMGVYEDIEHNSPLDLEGIGYGSIYQYMKRENPSYKLKQKVVK